jgi:hypothetical protein
MVDLRPLSSPSSLILGRIISSPATFGGIRQRRDRLLISRLGQVRATAANSGTLRVHLTLTGLETSTPVLSAVSHVLPAGLLVNAGFQGVGHKGTFLGSVSQAVELYDAETGELIYASVSKDTAHALDLTASFGRLDAARAGVRLGAQHLCDKLAKNHMAALAYTTPNASGPNETKPGVIWGSL